MEIVCEGCGARLSIPDEKLPATGAAKVTCPKCKGKIIVGPKAAEPQSGPEDSLAYSSGVLERFEEGVPAALVLFGQGEAARRAEEALSALGYRVSLAANVQEAQARIKFNTYQLVVLQEGFGASGEGRNPVLDFLNSLPMPVRRQMFVALVGGQLATLDRMAAFVRSVNLTVSEADLPGLEKILKNSIAEHELFYNVFNETLRGLGRV